MKEYAKNFPLLTFLIVLAVLGTIRYLFTYSKEKYQDHQIQGEIENLEDRTTKIENRII
jgi:hypothetical protein